MNSRSKRVAPAWLLLLGLAILPGAFAQESILVHTWMCDASAAIALGSDLFVAANDEDNILRTYRNRTNGAPALELNVSGFLQAFGKWPEVDLEGAARLDSRIYWISSHGRNKDGEYRENRHRFFATRILSADGSNVMRLAPEGQPYRDLLRDLLADARLRPFRLDAASKRAPKARAALNIEGLSATPDAHLLIGFRNPIPQGKALIVPLLNPAEVIQTQPARFGDPILLDLHGLGIRDIAWHSDRYYLIAGAYDGKGGSRLYHWAGPDHQPELCPTRFPPGFNPEAIVVYPDNPTHLQIVSDDGTANIGGQDCKNLADPAQRRFRSVWVDLTSELSSSP